MGLLMKKYLIINNYVLSFEFVDTKKIIKSVDNIFGKYALSADITNRVYLFEVE